MASPHTRSRSRGSARDSGTRRFGVMHLGTEPMIRQRRDDAAIADAIAMPMRQHQFEFRAQTLEHRDPAIDRVEMPARDAIGLGAFGLPLIGERQQLADGRQRKAELARMPDEYQLLPMCLPIAALPSRSSPRRGQQADILVIADRLDFAADTARQNADRHGNVDHA